MTVTVVGGARTGSVRIPASKSQAHRLLMLAALGKKPVTMHIRGVSEDIAATMACLRALGAGITQTGETVVVTPMETVQSPCELPCGESGSTLRFLLPVAAALGADATFLRRGRLPNRPLAPLDAELARHGVSLKEDGASLHVSGQLKAGDYAMAGNVSSQYFTGLLLALPLLRENSTLSVEGKLESAPYVAMTEDALALAGVELEKSEAQYCVRGNQTPQLPQALSVEGDWSNAAFFLCAGALSEQGITVQGLNPDSKQGDRAVLEILSRMGAEVTENGDAVTVKKRALRGAEIDAAEIPDLIPVLSVLAAYAEGETRIVNAARLRLKESDRLQSTAALLTALGADVCEQEDGLVLHGKEALSGGEVDAFGDHRIAMSAAVAASGCEKPVIIHGAESVSKSYPKFFEDFSTLSGGNV